MHLRAYDAYCKKYGPQQALIEGWCRGDFGTEELNVFIPGWRNELSRLTELERTNKALHRELDDMTERCRTAEQRVRAALPVPKQREVGC